MYTYSRRVGTGPIPPTSSLHGHIYNCNTDCDPWLQKVKPAAFNPLVSRRRSRGLALSTPRKMRHCSVTMVTRTFPYGNHHPELCGSLLCEDQVRVFTRPVCFACAAQLRLCPLPQAPIFAKHLPAPCNPTLEHFRDTTGTLGAPTRGRGWADLLSILRGEWLVPFPSLLQESSSEDAAAELY